MNLIKRVVMFKEDERYELNLERLSIDSFKVVAQTKRRRILRANKLTLGAAQTYFENIVEQKQYEGFFVEKVFDSPMPLNLDDYVLPSCSMKYIDALHTGKGLTGVNIPYLSKPVVISSGVFNPQTCSIVDNEKNVIAEWDRYTTHYRPQFEFVVFGYLKDQTITLSDIHFYEDIDCSSMNYYDRRKLLKSVQKSQALSNYEVEIAAYSDKSANNVVYISNSLGITYTECKVDTKYAVVSSISDKSMTLGAFKRNKSTSFHDFSSVEKPENMEIKVFDIVSYYMDDGVVILNEIAKGATSKDCVLDDIKLSIKGSSTAKDHQSLVDW